MSLAIDAILWEWLGEAGDPGADAAAIAALEAAGLLSPERAGAWRHLVHDPPPARGDAAAAERHLEALVAAVPAMSHHPTPQDHAASRRFHGALEALGAAGVLDAAGVRRWSERALDREAPWLDAGDRDLVLNATGPVAIDVPPETPQQAAELEAAQRRFERLGHRGATLAVLPAEAVARRDGLVLLAVVLCADAVEVLFHFLGDDHPVFEPPALTDGAGTVYAPVLDEPVGSCGDGIAFTGAWRYLPHAPPDARAFAAEWRGARWAFQLSVTRGA